MDELANRSHTTKEKIGTEDQGSQGVVETKPSNNNRTTGNINSFKRSLTEDNDDDQVTLSKDVRVINDLIEDLGRLETAKSQVQLRMSIGNPSNLSETKQQNLQHRSLNPRSRLTSQNSALGTSASSPGFGSRNSINQISKKMVDNEIEGVQFNRKRMHSTTSMSSGGRSLSGDPSRYGDQVIIKLKRCLTLLLV